MLLKERLSLQLVVREEDQHALAERTQRIWQDEGEPAAGFIFASCNPLDIERWAALLVADLDKEVGGIIACFRLALK